MTPEMVLDLTYLALFTAAKLSAPVLGASIVVGILINIIQTATSIRDQSLTFVPKLIAAGIALGLSLPWAINEATGFYTEMLRIFAQVAPGS
jgi:flagellar biosynthesis protein FliQ